MNVTLSGRQALAALALLVAAGAGGFTLLSRPHQDTAAVGEPRPSPKPTALSAAPLFSDNMVLQQKAPIRVWGEAPDGEKVTVTFEGASASTVSDYGRWSVTLPPSQRPAGGPYTLTVAGTKTLTFKNVLLGEVWVCSGQSNMQFSLGNCEGGDKAIASAANPRLRLFRVKQNGSAKKETDFSSDSGGWQVAGPNTTRDFSGVAYYFGRDLQKARNVPIGLIQDCFGGSTAEQWIPEATLAADPVLKAAIDEYPAAVAKYKQDSEAYQAAEARARAENKPAPPNKPGEPHHFSDYYNAMIAPLANFPVAGVIWYQGEANWHEPSRYKVLLPAVIKTWRQAWNKPGMPFLVVQMPPINDPSTDPNAFTTYSEVREGQTLTAGSVPNTGLVVLTDTHEKDLHPKRKEVVGVRLALQARRVAYGEKVAADTPVLRSVTTDGGAALIHFDHVGRGLKAARTNNRGDAVPGGKVIGFALAGADGKFVWADGQIVGRDTVKITAPGVAAPVMVRYGWADFPLVNLLSGDNLPAAPFRAQTPPAKPTTIAQAHK